MNKTKLPQQTANFEELKQLFKKAKFDSMSDEWDILFNVEKNDKICPLGEFYIFLDDEGKLKCYSTSNYGFVDFTEEQKPIILELLKEHGFIESNCSFS